MRKMGGDLTNTVYQYNRHGYVISLIVAQFLAAGYSIEPAQRFGDAKPNVLLISDVSGAKFHNGVEGSKYLTIEIKGLKQYEKCTNRKGTAEECITLQEKDRKCVTEVIQMYFANNTLVSELDVANLVTDLKYIRQYVSEISSKVATQSKKNNALQRIDKLNDKIKVQVLGETDGSS